LGRGQRLGAGTHAGRLEAFDLVESAHEGALDSIDAPLEAGEGCVGQLEGATAGEAFLRNGRQLVFPEFGVDLVEPAQLHSARTKVSTKQRSSGVAGAKRW
jgi:hypothetical protein